MSTPLNGRVTVYTNQVPYEADVLRSNTYKMADVSKLAETVLGTGTGNATLVSGLPCLPISPPGMQVTVGPGCLYSFQNYDDTAYSVLPADTDPNHRLYKQAINFDLVTLNTPAPLVVGNSVIYLVEGAFETLDVNVISRPYFNSADPTSPIFNDMSDTRTDNILINVISGTASPSPTPPSPTPGFVPLYYVTVTFGQTSIVPNNITVATGAPFVTQSLTQKTGYQDIRSETFTYFQDTGSVNSLVVTPVPSYINFNNGTTITVQAANTITGPCTLSVNGFVSIPIKVVEPGGLVDTTAGQIVAGGIYTFYSDGTNAQLANPSLNASTFYGASVYPSISQGFGGATKINYDTIIYDTNSLFDSVNHRFVTRKVGYFSFNINLGFTGAGTATVIGNLFKNGVLLVELVTSDVGGSGVISGYIEDYSTSGSDYYEIFASVFGTGKNTLAGNLYRFQMKFLGD